MRLNFYKNIISLFLVTTFLLLRVVSAHAFSHFSDDTHPDTNCELCEIITASNQLTPFIGDTTEEIEQKSTADYQEHKVDFSYETSKYSITLPKSVYNKPPPTL
ncbi:hypothetical protein J8L88_17255 [Aquimarina sp. MMG015]|uniref:hypothetical protein n=1 Tax=Aquimarina sp. MMG015 TaxID=2822689 RepID=UPI001B3A63FA|nr:hypothetical protein [Aquimarina sp. MMG015]MBQ4804612.1 hypothetical protein [Aquimarina sp. MMG015]